jgi:hypothetical protein
MHNIVSQRNVIQLHKEDPDSSIQVFKIVTHVHLDVKNVHQEITVVHVLKALNINTIMLIYMHSQK